MYRELVRQCRSPSETFNPFGPTAFPQAGQTVLAYELYIGNYEAAGLTIFRVDILAENRDGTLLKTYQGDELTKCLAAPTRTVGDNAVVFIWVTIDREQIMPSTLFHRVFFTDGSVVDGASTSITTGGPLVIAPPVRGERWVAFNGPSNLDFHHRHSLLSLNGKPYIAQRFAVDWLRLGADGLRYSGAGTGNTDWYSYGTDLLAVADGTVVEARDGMPDNNPVGSIPPLQLRM